MKAVIRWAIKNTPAMNTLMVGSLLVGAFSLAVMHRELFPNFDLEIIQVTVPYPGASPAEVEEGICQKIEEGVRSLDGIKRLSSIALEGSGTVVLELESDADVQRILGDVRSEVDRIPSFPILAEDPVVKQIVLRNRAIRVGVVGPDDFSSEAELQLRAVTEKVRDDLLQLPSVSQATIQGARDYQIDIEISEQTLRKYGLTLQRVADIVRRENLELPGGYMRTDSKEIVLRGKSKETVGRKIAKIPLVTQPNGVVLTIDDLGEVRDEFVDTAAISRINGHPGLAISIDKTASEDLLQIIKEVRGHVDEPDALPPGYSIVTWADQSNIVRDRLELLMRNGLQGLILVFLVLAIFLEIRLAFWVAMGIPMAMLGASIIMLVGGQTLNMLSMFAFIMALGILVDDAIVVGENVYAHRQRGAGLLQAAVDGTYEVMPSVIASVATTIIAFSPMLFVPGIMGKFIAVMPFAVIAMLCISLLECTFILPCHLTHGSAHGASLTRRVARMNRGLPIWLRFSLGPVLWLAAAILSFLTYPFWRLGGVFRAINQTSDRLMNTVIHRFYAPTVRWSLDNRWLVVSVAASVMLVAVGVIRAGLMPFNAMPKLDGDEINATVRFPNGVSMATTDAATRKLEEAILEIDRPLREEGTPLVRVTHRVVGNVNAASTEMVPDQSGGSHAGVVHVELVDCTRREASSQQVLADWREKVGEIPGVESLTFKTAAVGPGGAAIEFKLLARIEDMAALEAAVEECKQELARKAGVQDIVDDSSPGKWEYQYSIKPRAEAMGVTNDDLGRTVRASYYGEEVMRLQRGRHEVKLMVRYPEEERRSLANFDDIRVRTGSGAERPFTELADVQVERGYSVINRRDQLRSITITADVEEGVANAKEIIGDLQSGFLRDLLAREEYRGIRVIWEGQQEQTTESVDGLLVGLLVALTAMFALLTFQFRSYAQPLLVMAIIPFGAIGAIVGHFVMGLDLTLFSLFGMVALTGLVINDSIVLIDFINHRVRDGLPIREALIEAGCRRFRPVMLTSLTTVAGLFPILMEKSLQAQVLIPMATSLSFGLIFATLLVLVLVPTFYRIYHGVTGPKEPEDQPPRPLPPTQLESQPTEEGVYAM